MVGFQHDKGTFEFQIDGAAITVINLSKFLGDLGYLLFQIAPSCAGSVPSNAFDANQRRSSFTIATPVLSISTPGDFGHVRAPWEAAFLGFG